PDPLQVSAESHSPLDESPHDVPAGVGGWVQRPVGTSQTSAVQTLPSLHWAEAVQKKMDVVSVKVQVTVSFEFKVMVACALRMQMELLLPLVPAVVQVRLVKLHPDGMLSSEADHVPGGTLKVCVLSSVASLSSSSEKF